MIKSLDNNSCCPEQQQCCQDEQSFVVADDLKLTSVAGDEVFLSHLGHVRADSRVTLKRVSYTSHRIDAGMKISTVHSSTVTTTRSWSSPGVVNLASDGDGHAVLGLDLLNQIPSSGDLFGWINNLDALVVEKYVGLQKEQVGTESACTTDANSQQKIATEEKALNNEAGKEGDKNPATGDCASGSELFTIRHSVSFSQIGSTK